MMASWVSFRALGRVRAVASLAVRAPSTRVPSRARYHACCATTSGSVTTDGGATSPTSMRAVVLDQPSAVAPPHDVLHPRDVPVPAPAAGQVRVRVHATGVCHRDVLDRQGAFPFISRPSILGHEIGACSWAWWHGARPHDARRVAAGVIDEVGEGVCNSRVGERVVSLHWAPCGTCQPCSRGDSTICANARHSFFGLTNDGGYAQYTVNGASAFVPVPAGWAATEAAPVQCTHGTVWHAAIVKGRLQPGESVLVTGASGGVGSAAVQIFSAMGARVIALTSTPDKVQYSTCVQICVGTRIAS